MEVIEPSSQTWRTFLASHLGQIVATDFFAMPTATCRLLFVLVILDDGDGVVLRDRHLEIQSQRNDQCRDEHAPLLFFHLQGRQEVLQHPYLDI